MHKSFVLAALAIVFGWFGTSEATPITFDLAGSSDSSFAMMGSDPWFGWPESDGEPREGDIFTVPATRFGPDAYSMETTLAFDSSNIAATGTGQGGFDVIFGLISGDYPNWNQYLLPDGFTIAEMVNSIDFGEGRLFTCCNTTAFHPLIAKQGERTSPPPPTPEPVILLLLGSGVLGTVFCRKRSRVKADPDLK